jgi:hypothetical protein
VRGSAITTYQQIFEYFFQDDVAAILPLGVSLVLFGHYILLTLFTSSGKANKQYLYCTVGISPSLKSALSFIFRAIAGSD